MRNVVFYDAETDDLLISCKSEDERVKKNFMFDDFIISVTDEGKIVGLEIRNVSRFLEENGINPELLTRFKEIELNITPKSSFVKIALSFDMPDKENIIRRKIPITHIPLERF